jgi:hypothetical protein
MRKSVFSRVAADEAYWGGEETGAIGRQTEPKTLIIVVAEEDGKGIGRIRLRTTPDASSASLHGFIQQTITPGSTVRTDGWKASLGLDGYACVCLCRLGNGRSACKQGRRDESRSNHEYLASIKQC